MTFLAGNAAYVLHTGPGIRGGGAADVSGKLRRHANFDELPSFTPIVASLAAARRYLPDGLANWTRHAPNAPDAPIHGFDRLYMASSGRALIGLAIDLRQPVTLTARRSMSLDVRQTATGKIVEQFTVKSGDNIRLRAGEALVVAGRVE